MNHLKQHSPRLQFHLSYLIYLLTLVALAFALLRQVVDIRAGWQLNAVMFVYLAVLVAYFAFRFPFLIRRLRHGNRAKQSRRAELGQVIDEARQRAREADSRTEIE